MRILSVVNQKGGCGKTTTAVNLAACLARLERKVLLVDMDPQGHATSALNAVNLPVPRDLRSALLNFYEEAVPIAQMAVPTVENLDLIPSLLSLVALEQELNSAPNRERRLRDLLERGGCEAYDYVLIDSPPNLGILTINALTASREIVVPVDTGTFSLHGLRRLFHIVDLIQERMGTRLEPHILLTFYDPRVRLAKTILAELEGHFPRNVLQAKIRGNIHLKEAASYGLPVVQHRPNSLGAMDYQELAKEIVAQEVVAAERASGAAAAGPVRDPEARREPPSPPVAPNEVVFQVMAPAAREVHVTGEFSNWQLNEFTVLERGEKGIWKRRIPLSPGNYQYKYFVDGKWVVDPENPLRIVTEDGVVNSLLKVR